VDRTALRWHVGVWDWGSWRGRPCSRWLPPVSTTSGGWRPGPGLRWRRGAAGWRPNAPGW